MRILPVNIFNTQPNRFGGRKNTEFPAFCSTTSAGNPLRKLRHIKCPYFGVEMLSASELPRIENMLDGVSATKDRLKILRKYKKNMQKTEKRIFGRFEKAIKDKPDLTFPDFLKIWYNEAITKLKLEEFNVLDDVDKISLKLSPENALAVHSKTTRCRQVILENNKEDTFKRRILLNSLDELIPAKGEGRVFELLKNRAAYLPTSGTSENAFVVKYAERTEEEIAKRLLRPSAATIEHIKPNSKGGLNAIGNFMLASAGANNLRSNMPLVDFIAMFPKIPKYCQAYIEQIIECIHKGGLKGNETYPYKVKRVLEKESKNIINLDISMFKLTKEEAKEAVRKRFVLDKRKITTNNE